jgi:succinyl-CoA synthetase beta subunit
MLGIGEALEAIDAAVTIGEAWTAAPRTPMSPAQPAPGKGRLIDEAEAKELMARAGLPVPPGRRVRTPDEAVEAAFRIGFPVALKAIGLAHKSEHGAVRLGIESVGTVGAAAEALRKMGDGLLVERMVDGAVAELLVGVTRDAVFGLVLTIGAGGILTELLRDSRVLLWPATGDEIRSALRQLRLFPLLDGYRGRPKADIDAAVSAIEGIGAFAAAARPAILELEVNPLIVCARGGGALVADVLMVREDER